MVATSNPTASGVQHQSRRANTALLANYNGMAGEFTADTLNNRAVLYDGTTLGGWPHALALTQTVTSTAATVTSGAAMVMVFSTSAACTITLPKVSQYPPGQRLVIWDAGGNSTVNNITVVTNASTDSVYTSTGGTSTTAMVITTAGGNCALFGNSSNRWILESTA